MGGHLLPSNGGTGVTDSTGRKRPIGIRVPKDGAKLGLYDTDGKPVGKDQTDGENTDGN
ncbi:hypothetical protein KZP16_05585 [Bifidobacterium pseudocatenulatum]|uniref:hypothetical protein n=1 Tax=Bifidobacterium pseudocatenulatum TaxID=28026 RepID=UPI001CFC7476|nr:hypothetical protein [Bifidobacterium pseudocatenulatum]MCB4916205.1 hypothetical protein [Bifidobacterium pseudocatenulatum]